MDWLHVCLPVFISGALVYAIAYTVFERRRRRDEAMRDRAQDDAASRVQESEKRLRLVFEALPTSLLMVDANGRVVFANPQAAALFGHPVDALMGMDIETLIPGGHLVGEQAEALLADGADRFATTDRRLRARHRDGRDLTLLVRLRVADTAEGRFVMLIAADLSGQVEMERERDQHREELAHLARVGTLAELSGSMAHELNQPLAAILSNAQAAQRFLAQDPPNLDEVRESIGDIIADDKRAGEVIRRLRAMLKKQAPDYQLIDTNLLVTEVLRLARSDLLNRKVRVVTDLQPGLPAVRADQVQLQQVLINLILNAGDAMTGEPEPHELTVTTLATSEGRVEIRVCDNGTGIPPADLERIFEPFVTSKRDGIGLGLAVCRSIVLDHGGRLWATDNLGRGATLHVSLPRADAAGGPAA